MTNILRDPISVELGPNEENLINIPLETSRGKFLTSKDKLHIKIGEEEQKANKLGLPFSIAGVMSDVEDKNREASNQLKRQGYVSKDLDLKLDWKKYSDLNNFEIIGEGTQHDPKLSDKHRLPIYLKWKKYRFNGTTEERTVMESADEAVKRAQ